MPKPLPTNLQAGRNRVREEALEWFVRLQDYPNDQALRQKFETWLALSAQHVEAYQAVCSLWTSPTLSVALANFDKKSAAPRKPSLTVLATAAALLLCLSWSLTWTGLMDAWQADYVTTVGERQRIVLADGSIAILNTDTALASIDNGRVRGVRLLKGEAYFEVKPDPHRPFLVHAESGTVRVVGTRFSVRSGPAVGVRVDSGIVACRAGNGAELQLTADQQATLSSQGVTRLGDIDRSTAMAWLIGRLVFRDRPLAEVIAELDRYHPGAIFVADKQLRSFRITGNYKLADSRAVIRSLADLSGAKVVRLSPYLTILKR